MEENSIVIYAGVVIVSIIISLVIAGGLTLGLKVRQRKSNSGGGKKGAVGQLLIQDLYEELLLLQDDISSQRQCHARINTIRGMIKQLDSSGAPQREILFQLKSVLDRYENDPDGLVLPLINIIPQLRNPSA
jgi:hypothetical protein